MRVRNEDRNGGEGKGRWHDNGHVHEGEVPPCATIAVCAPDLTALSAAVALVVTLALTGSVHWSRIIGGRSESRAAALNMVHSFLLRLQSQKALEARRRVWDE